MSPRSSKQFEEMREEKKTLIMDVALGHFANEGFHTTTIDHIAKHAGISKGLMYNYFDSKEVLLVEIIERSVAEIYLYFDPDRDGYLAEDEFELFVRKVLLLLSERRSIWRLFFQMLMHKDVRDQFLGSAMGANGNFNSHKPDDCNPSLPGIVKMIKEYFERKKPFKPSDYDPDLEMHMFINTLLGFALTTIYVDDPEEIHYDKIVNRILEIYK
jgi:AcrR family transcriptional regulator